MTSLPNFFDIYVFLLSSLLLVQVWCKYRNRFWSYDNFFSLRIEQKSENQKYSIWVSASILRLGQVRGTKLGTDVSNKKLLNTKNYQDYSLYQFWVIKGKPTGRGIKLRLPPLVPRLKLNTVSQKQRTH